MYILWVASIVVVLATTFTNFQYEDLNFIAIVLLVFTVLNSALILTSRSK
jgi:hypothetical protein